MTNIRRNRGYSFEYYLTNNLNNNNWQSRILGGASTGLPDIIATNNQKSILFSIEAKSTVGDLNMIPQDEVIRCYRILSLFSIYQNKFIVFAFKFGAGKVKEGKTQRKKGQIKYYYFIIKSIKNIDNIKYVYCDYDGNLTFSVNELQHTTISYFMYNSIEDLKNGTAKVEGLNSQY